MSTQIGNLWPEIGEPVGRTPSSILKEQASALARQTKGLIEAEVKTYKVIDSALVLHAFKLVAPALDDYRVELFAISHPMMLYPVTVVRDSTGSKLPDRGLSDRLKFDHLKSPSPERDLYTEEEFVEWLKRVFSSQHTQTLLSALILQSKG